MTSRSPILPDIINASLFHRPPKDQFIIHFIGSKTIEEGLANNIISSIHHDEYDLFIRSLLIMLASSSRVLLRTATGIGSRTALNALVARSAVGPSSSSALLGGSSSTKVRSATTINPLICYASYRLLS